MYTHNKYPRCYNSDALHELTPMLASCSGQHKSHTKITFFFKKNAVGHMTFAGRLTKSAGQTVHASFILEPSYFAHIISLYPLLII